ncbi:MAG: hypothetical protein E2O85_01150, partial [Bacteroidetes bacterium]
MNIATLQDKKLSELKDLARGMSLHGFSAMRKQDIIYMILEARADAVAGASSPAGDNSKSRRPDSDQRPKSGRAKDTGRNGDNDPESATDQQSNGRSASEAQDDKGESS